MTNAPKVIPKEGDNAFTIISIEQLLYTFWINGGKEKYEATLEMRRANGIPDKQWFAAQLMGLVDDAEITYNAEETTT